MIRRHEVLLPTGRGEVDRGRRVVCAACQELQCQEGMGCPAPPKVEFDRIWRPGAGNVPGDDEIEGEPPENALAGQPGPDLDRVRTDGAGVGGVSGEDAAQVALAALAAE